MGSRHAKVSHAHKFLLRSPMTATDVVSSPSTHHPMHSRIALCILSPPERRKGRVACTFSLPFLLRILYHDRCVNLFLLHRQHQRHHRRRRRHLTQPLDTRAGSQPLLYQQCRLMVLLIRPWPCSLVHWLRRRGYRHARYDRDGNLRDSPFQMLLGKWATDDMVFTVIVLAAAVLTPAMLLWTLCTSGRSS